MSRRLEFKESPIKARSFLTPEQIQARSVARFGIKVQITDPTIAKIKKAILIQEILIDDPDDVTSDAESRPRRKIKRTINLANVALSFVKQMKGIASLVKTNIELTEKQGLSVGKLVLDVLDRIKDFDTLRKEDSLILKKIINQLNLPTDPVLAGFQNRMTGEAIKSISPNAVTMFIISNHDKIQQLSSVGDQIVLSGLTIDQPLHSVVVQSNLKMIVRPIGLRLMNNINKRLIGKGRYIDLKWLAVLPNDKIITPTGVIVDAAIEIAEEGTPELIEL